ncbi:MAG: HAMP domain-containing sensor histidine kinase [Candidatus Krumholzibacteriota bacterium]
MSNRLGVFYFILVLLLLVMGAWWLFFLTRIGNDQAEYEIQKMATNKMHASFLIQADPKVRDNPEAYLGPSFPHLNFVKTANGVEVVVDPLVMKSIRDDARATRNMFLYEGFFFIILLVAGSTILYLSWRSEVKFKQTRELFLSGATHEFKTPLASIKLYTETLGREGLGEEDRARIRARVVDDVVRLENLVDEVLSMSADDTFAQGPQVRLDLAAECQAVMDSLRGFAQDHKAQFILDAPAGVFILGRELTFHLALRNLVVNAVNHSPDPVCVTVTVRPGDQWHRVAVADNGPGIPRRLHEKIFECFFSGRRDSRKPGTGVGLHLVRRNIETMGGRVTLESEEGAGSTFTLVVPAHGAGG